MECTYFWGGGRRGTENFKSVPQILLGLVMLFEFNGRINTKNLYQLLGLSNLY